jgi:hypothetical protein
MKTLIKPLLICLVIVFSYSCNTYYIAASTQPLGIYSDNSASSVAYDIPVGSVLLLKGKPKNGLTQVRYHSDKNWYWVDMAYLNLVPNENPKFYDFTYSSLESRIASTKTKGDLKVGISTVPVNTGYDATIQTGSRGGKYYINKNGNKTYVKRSTPSGTTKRVGGKGSRSGKH